MCCVLSIQLVRFVPMLSARKAKAMAGRPTDRVSVVESCWLLPTSIVRQAKVETSSLSFDDFAWTDLRGDRDHVSALYNCFWLRRCLSISHRLLNRSPPPYPRRRAIRWRSHLSLMFSISQCPREDYIDCQPTRKRRRVETSSQPLVRDPHPKRKE